MRKFNIVEKFVSIDGEGPMAGSLATFIRFKGCNLRCSWCDTSYSWEATEKSEEMSADGIYSYIKEKKINHVTLTGGEPLIQEGIMDLIKLLSEDKSLLVHIETNGTVDITPFKTVYTSSNLRYIIDYKLPSSTMTKYMEPRNLDVVGENDVYKFVIGSKNDLNKAYELIKKHDLDKKCQVYLSPVTDYIEPSVIVDFMKENLLKDVKLQLQLHKIIWDKNRRGV